jgi:hypothetical protein
LGRGSDGRTVVMIVIGVAVFCGRRWHSASDLSWTVRAVISGDNLAFYRSEFLIIVG